MHNKEGIMLSDINQKRRRYKMASLICKILINKVGYNKCPKAIDTET